MKLFSIPYNFSTQYLFLIFFYSFIISTKSQYTFFNYTENASGTAFPHSQPLILSINTYEDGTALVLIARAQDAAQNNSIQDASCSGLKLEPALRIRVIKLDGTVIEVNYRYNLDLLNYCIINDTSGNILVPITVYPLYEPLFLVNFVKAANSSDPVTYEEWGLILDWNGNNRSQIYYGPSHTNDNNTWAPQSAIQLNVNSRHGFLRLSTKRNDKFDWSYWQQYLIDDSGKISLLKSGNISIIPANSVSYQCTIMPTIDGGYAILSVNSSNNGNDSLLTTRGGLYAIFLSYNQSIQPKQILLYQVTLPNINFTGLYCDIAPKGIGYRCLIAAKVNNSELDYILVNFLTSESVISVNLMQTVPNTNITGLSGWGMEAMPFGGYILYATVNEHYYIYPFDEHDNPLEPLGSFVTNSFAANSMMNSLNLNNLNAASDIMKNNNTFLLASPFTDNKNASWSLFIISLPKVFQNSGYGNLQILRILPPVNTFVDSSTTTLNITFNNTIVLSNGYIFIYKSSDNSVRQRIQAKNSDFVKLLDDHKTVNIKIIGSTFNQFDETYYVQMDANFVKDEKLYEPLTGINEGIVVYTSKYKSPPSEESAFCVAQLTVNATKRFKTLSETNQTEYFNNMLQEISAKLPVQRERLSTDGHIQYVQSIPGTNLQFSISINLTTSSQKGNSVPGVISDLNNMIKYKSITTFSSGLTDDLDSTYGFKEKGNLFDEFKNMIATFSVGSLVNAVLYGISQRAKNDNEPDENGQTNYKDHANNQALRMLNGLTGGLFVTSHSFFLTRFSFVDANSKPEFSLPSKVIWAAPIIINVVVFIYVKCKGGFTKNFHIEQYLFMFLALYDSDTLLIVNKVESIFENDFMITAKLRAFADLIIKNIPLIAIQIIYFRSIVTYSIIPFFVLLTTIFKIILGLIRSIIELLASRKHEENKKETNEEKKKEMMKKKIQSLT
ncbi:hypothetical protein C2G38_2067362 [Gigaspora rosea]|uniref:Uncharacterized protein n=1 Tax=Gigaspora rosea TaxID=44941 RepID=A0A397VUM8_9GLOM|nr:hypothetical protein C2G38_2067362 [Gigaspora rosea]